MKIVPMAQVAAGAQLARDLRDASDRLILARGTLLTQPILERLQAVGVAELPLEPAAEDLAAERLRQAKALDERFAGHEASAAMMAVKDAVREYWEKVEKD